MDSKEYWEKPARKTRDKSDIAETFEAMDAERKVHRKNKKIEMHERVRALGIPYEIKNEMEHIIFEHEGHKIDFWPSSEKWCDRKFGKYGQGLDALLERLGMK